MQGKVEQILEELGSAPQLSIRQKPRQEFARAKPLQSKTQLSFQSQNSLCLNTKKLKKSAISIDYNLIVFLSLRKPSSRIFRARLSLRPTSVSFID